MLTSKHMAIMLHDLPFLRACIEAADADDRPNRKASRKAASDRLNAKRKVEGRVRKGKVTT